MLAVLLVQLCPRTVHVDLSASGALICDALAEASSLPTNASDTAAGPPPAIIDRMIAAVAGWLNNLVGGDSEALKLYAAWIVGAPALVLLVLIVMPAASGAWRAKVLRNPENRDRPGADIAIHKKTATSVH